MDSPSSRPIRQEVPAVNFGIDVLDARLRCKGQLLEAGLAVARKLQLGEFHSTMAGARWQVPMAGASDLMETRPDGRCPRWQVPIAGASDLMETDGFLLGAKR